MPSAGICDWVGYCLCIRDHPLAFKEKALPRKVTGTAQTFDAVIVWKDQPKKESTGGMAYDVILKPAMCDSPNLLPPTKTNRQISQESLTQKLRDAEERKLALEAERINNQSRSRRISAAHQRINSVNESFSKEVKEKIDYKHGKMEINKSAQVQALQERLREHARHVIEVKDAYEKSQEEYKQRLLQDITQKQEEYKENREKSLQTIKEKLEEHEKHCDEVIQTSKTLNKNTEEKILRKMEQTRINREKQLDSLMEKLQDHDFRVQELKTKRKSLNIAPDDEEEEFDDGNQ